MTPEQLWRHVRRRWWVAILGLLVSGAACLSVYNAPGVYWASTKVLFLPPVSVQGNQLAPDSHVTIAMAGIIQTEINGGSPERGAIDPDLTIVDQGIYDGWSVRLTNRGGQWANNFDQGLLVVQASGPSREVVEERMESLFTRIAQLTANREAAAGVASDSRVILQRSPQVLTIQHSRGYPKRAIAAIMVVGVGLSAAACVLADRGLSRRHTRGRRNVGIGNARVWHASRGDQDGPRRAAT